MGCHPEQAELKAINICDGTVYIAQFIMYNYGMYKIDPLCYNVLENLQCTKRSRFRQAGEVRRYCHVHRGRAGKPPVLGAESVKKFE